MPPDQAYGSKGVEGKIPPNATLLFVLDILDVIKVMDDRR
ncbi:FKBP-type peptidyl-prolyl cis-trans isomerase [Streptomyces albus]|nr:FKBP-type peptidyl-prolyl cis-trans isomerase [Streptomyces albus]UVN58561.1 FKBP-type peptidyl-prolyl cis-trans isomerase [Streptomyces albus]